MATRTWTLLHEFAEAHNRHGELAGALGFRLGAGRGKVLFLLREQPLTLTEIAENTGSDLPYATVIVDKLQAHGLVTREPHPEDRRRKLVSLTGAGREAIDTADAIRHRPPRAVDALTVAELRELGRLLQRLVDADATPG